MKKFLFYLSIIIFVYSLYLFFIDRNVGGGFLVVVISSLVFSLSFQFEDSLYIPGEKITGKEKVIDLVNKNGIWCRYISKDWFWVFTDSSVLFQDNLIAVNAFSLVGNRKQDVMNNWPKSKKMPKRIYFFKENKDVDCSVVEYNYENIIERLELNELAAFNAVHKDFCNYFPNATQRRYVEDQFCCAIFGPVCNTVYVDVGCIAKKKIDKGIWLAGKLKS